MSEEDKTKILDKRSAIILVAILAWASYLAADGTTHHDSFVLVLLNATTIFAIGILCISIWFLPALVLYWLGFIGNTPPNLLIAISCIIGAIITLKAADYFQVVYEHIQRANLEVIYG